MFFIFQATKEIKNKKEIEAMEQQLKQQQQLWGDKAKTDRGSQSLKNEVPKKTLVGTGKTNARQDFSSSNSFVGQSRKENIQQAETKGSKSEFSGANYFVGRQKSVENSKLEATTIWDVAGDALGKAKDWSVRQYNAAKDWVTNLF